MNLNLNIQPNTPSIHSLHYSSTTNRGAYMAMDWIVKMKEVSCDME